MTTTKAQLEKALQEEHERLVQAVELAGSMYDEIVLAGQQVGFAFDQERETERKQLYAAWQAMCQAIGVVPLTPRQRAVYAHGQAQQE